MDKLKTYPTNSYVFLWVIMSCMVALVHLVGMILISNFSTLGVQAASGAVTYGCTFSPAAVDVGKSITVKSNRGNVFGEITIQGAYLSTAVPLGTLAKKSTESVVIPPVTSGLYAVRVGSPAVNCKTTDGGDLAIQNTFLPSPTPTPTPTAAAASCVFTPSSITAGGSISLTGRGFGGLTYTVNLLGLTSTQFYTLGQFNGSSGVYTIPATAPSGVYRVGVFAGNTGGNGVICSPDLVVN